MLVNISSSDPLLHQNLSSIHNPLLHQNLSSIHDPLLHQNLSSIHDPLLHQNLSSIHDPLLHQNLSSIYDPLPFSRCLVLKPSSLVYAAFYITNILFLLPLCLFIIYRGLHQWRGQRSGATAPMMSHSDCIILHVAAIELLGVSGFALCLFGVFSGHIHTYRAGYNVWTVTWYGEIFFHLLTCLERYLAVVHPITYLSLRSHRGVRIRNICTGCVWLLSCGLVCLPVSEYAGRIMDMCIFCFTLTSILFSSVSVLCVLIRPGPGKQDRERERVDQSKQRAFNTILAVLVVLTVRFVWNMTRASFFVLEFNECTILVSGVWFNLPSSLVLPLQFFLRVGLSACCRNNKP